MVGKIGAGAMEEPMVVAGLGVGAGDSDGGAAWVRGKRWESPWIGGGAGGG